MQVPFARADVTEAEENAVLEVLRSGWLTSGPKMRELEQRLSAYVGGGVQSIAVNSATSGLHLALEACNVTAGDEVLVPTWTFTATAEVVRYLRARPVFVDVDPITLNIDVRDLAQKITLKTAAIVPVHFGGRPCDMEAIWELATKHRLAVVEDAAHALGSTYRQCQIGDGQSDAVVFSFYATKCMTTAEGGAVVTKDAYKARRMRDMRMHGISRDVFDRYTSKQPDWEYDVIAPGFKYNMPDVLAAIGIEQLKRLNKMRMRRESIARTYSHRLKDVVGLPPWYENGSWHLYVVDTPCRDQFIERMYEKGVGCSVHFKPLHKMTVWKPYAKTEFAGANTAYYGAVSLPIYSTMTVEEVQYVVEAVKACTRS